MFKTNKLFLPAGIAACVLLVIIFAARGCRLSDKAQSLQVKYDTYKALTVQGREKSNEYIRQLQGQIKTKDTEIAGLNKSVGEKNTQIAKGTKKLADLEAAYSEAATDVLKIANLQQQVAGWKEQFNLSQQVVAEQQKIISALEVKFNDQVLITAQVQAALDKADALNSLGERRIAVLEKDARRLRFGSRVKTILIAGAVGYVGYTLLPKGK